MMSNSGITLQTCEIFRLITMGFGVGIINAVGITANMIAIVALSMDRSKKKTTYMLIGLEISDSIFLITHSILFSYNDLFKYFSKFLQTRSPLDNELYINITQKFLAPIVSGSLMASSWHMMLITFERFMAVCKPHHSNKLTVTKTIIAQAFIFVFTFSINSSRMLEYEAIKSGRNDTVWTISSTKLKVTKSYATYVTIQYWITQLIIPVTTLSLMTGLIIQVVYSKI